MTPVESSDDVDARLYGADLRRRWLMSHAERMAVLHVLRIAQPVSALEIGTAEGGSLQHIRSHARRTYSIDIAAEVRTRLAPAMPDVTFLTGDSKRLIAEVLRTCDERNEPLGFVLVDGDHTHAGVKGDLEALLGVRPSCPLWVLMHDSSNPECRTGIVDAPWSGNPHVHRVELDFVTGTLSEDPLFEGMVWGGFALALLGSEPRKGPLQVTASAAKHHAAVYRASRQFPSVRNKVAAWLAAKRRSLVRRLNPS